MKTKFPSEFDKLPTELQLKIASYLPTSALENATKTKITYTAGLFKFELATRNCPLFLSHVVCGKYEKVKEMLEKNIYLLFKRGKVTDCSERNFLNVSGFEYALWALDTPMRTTMLKCIPQNEEGKAVLGESYLNNIVK